MLYIELLSLTDDKATYEQFLDIESVYKSKEEMTKQQAARLWKRRYGEKVEKPRPEEMRRIKEAIRDFKGEREWAKVLESRIIETHDEKVKNYIAECGAELDENGYCKDYWARQTIERWEKELPKTIYQMYEGMGNDTTIYIIYKDGSTLYVSGSEIVGGDVTPKMQNIAYAHYQDGLEEFDTLIGNFDDTFPYSLDFTDAEENEHWEKVETYKSSVEIKFGTDWGKKHQIA